MKTSFANRIKSLSYNAPKFRWYYKFAYNIIKSFRFIFEPKYRSRLIYTRVFKNNYLQFSNFTLANRYPDLFKIAQEHFKDFSAPKILSFGCSTGEEIQSLAQYIPNAELVGVDINSWCIKKAKSRFASENIHFYHSLSDEFKRQTNFDAIFALAVFQHPENRHKKDQKVSAMPFSVFENQLIELDKKLKSGGLLLLDHLDFNFLETKLMQHYKIHPIENNMIERKRPIFNKNGERIASNTIMYRVFQKK